MERILLIGGNFKNRGAEAMALTALAELQRRYPGSELVLASYARNESKAYGLYPVPGADGASWRLIRNSRSPLKALWLALAAVLVGRLRRLALARDPYLQTLAGSSLVIDISGFALSSQRPLLRQVVYAFEVASARLLGVPFVAMTQAMGPFKGWPSRWLARRCIRGMSLLNIRGKESEAMVRALEPDVGAKLLRCADSAYLFPAADGGAADALLSKSSDGRRRFGVVPNVNIYRRSSPQGEENPYLRALVALTTHLTQTLDADVLFICHEVYEGEDDDEWLVEQVATRCQDRERIHRIGADHPAAVLKAVLGRLDFAIASRFHGLVALIGTGVPFLAVGWSHKYRELVEEAGVRYCLCDGQNMSPESLLEYFEAAWVERDANRARLEGGAPELAASARAAYDRIAEQFPTLTEPDGD